MCDVSNIFPWDKPVLNETVTLWFLGQAGYYIKSGECSVLIDPYLSDSAGRRNPPSSRSYPVPVDPSKIQADIFIVTHDHIDHLDPETIEPYQHKNTTMFVAPRFAARKLSQMGIKNITVIDQGDEKEVKGVRIKGVFALPTGPDCLDTAGYLITFPNGKSIYHTADTAYCNLLLKAAPEHADVLLTCINGKWGNLHIDEAIELTLAVKPKYVIPNHYDVMPLNSENPESFRYFLYKQETTAECVILKPLEGFTL